MSECVVRMPYPKDCESCHLKTRNFFTGDFICAKTHTFLPASGKNNNCPIVCVLPENHGRLVDELELFARCRPVKNFDNPDAPVIVKGAVIQSQTIVPAEAERSANEHKQKKYTNWIGEEMVEQQIDKDVSRFADGEWWKE